MVWFAILRHAPAILSAAEALFLRTKTSRADDHTRSVEMRIDELAESSRASAEVIQDMAKQLQALALVHDATVRKVRTGIGISIAASLVAVTAVVTAFVARFTLPACEVGGAFPTILVKAARNPLRLSERGSLVRLP